MTVIEGDAVVALLRDNTITIHSIEAITNGHEGLVQTFSFNNDCQPKSLSSNPYGIAVPNSLRDDRLATLTRPIIPPPRSVGGLPRLRSHDNILDAGTPFDEDTEFHLSSQTSRVINSPNKARSDSSDSSKITPVKPFTTLLTETLIHTDDAIITMSPKTWVVVADELIEQGQLDEAMAMLDAERKRRKRGEVEGDKVGPPSFSRYSHMNETRN